jgi:hypothetical protein
MTEPNEAPEAAAPNVMPEQEITFMGRKLWVRMPSPEQLLVWRRTLRQLQEAETKDWNAEQVMIALERTRKIIDSVLVNKADVTWLDDEMLEGNIDLTGTAKIINMTVETFADAAAEEGNRETRRAAKKATAKKATRKKATPSR